MPPEKYEPRPIVQPPPPPLSPPARRRPVVVVGGRVCAARARSADEPPDVARRGVPRDRPVRVARGGARRGAGAGAVSAITSPRPRARARRGGGGAPAGQSRSAAAASARRLRRRRRCHPGLGGGHATAAAPLAAAARLDVVVVGVVVGRERRALRLPRGEPAMSEITQPAGIAPPRRDRNQPELPASSESRRRASLGGNMSVGRRPRRCRALLRQGAGAGHRALRAREPAESATTRRVARARGPSSCTMAASSFTACAASSA